ncbi:MAG: glycosyltransferase, partial [bacterium]|nr:glycosyltransferase [bacterium]
IRNTFYKLGHGLLLYGHRAKAIGLGYGFRPGQLHVIYNSLDCELQDRTLAALPGDARQSTRAELFPGREDHPVLVNITRLHHYKKLDQLIRAAAKLEKAGRPVNVLIVGDGPHKEELMALADELGVSAVFTGAVYGEDELGRMLIASDVAVMPGPIGLLAMHALAYGVPAISHNSYDQQMPEFESIVDGKTGGFFTEDDLDSLVQTIEHQIGIEWTHEQRMEAARELIERFYNPVSQRRLIDRAVEGDPADDLFNARLERYTTHGSQP